jgi:hypothetical protein
LLGSSFEKLINFRAVFYKVMFIANTLGAREGAVLRKNRWVYKCLEEAEDIILQGESSGE